MKQFGQVNTAYHLNERAKKALDMPNGVFVVVETKDRRTNLAPILENHPVYVVKRWDRLLQLRGNFRSTAQKDFASEFEQDRRTVYLSGIIPEEVTSRHIEDIFVRAGSVINVQIIRRGTLHSLRTSTAPPS